MPDIPRHQLALYAVLGVLVVVLGVRYLRAANPAPQPAPVAVHEPAPSGGGSGGGGGKVVVHVAGAVRSPGVYRLRVGARVQDAIRHAGGPRGKADLNAINLAAKVADGQQVAVPQKGAAPVVAAGDGSAPTTPISLSSATLEQLESLDGVGPATAQKILDYRSQHGFRSVDDLAAVPGIGPKKLASIKPHVQP